MKKDFRVYLDDIIESCKKINRYIKDVDYATFESNEELQDAVLRRLEIIGEATNRLPEEFKEQYSEIAWRKATGMRNILIHMYDDVDFEIVWKTITEILPPFRKQIEELLQKIS